MKRTPMKQTKHVIPKALKDAVWERDGGWCVICGRGLNPDHWEAHHRKYLSRGGKDELCNLIAVCPIRCHIVAIHEDSTGLATANGWAVSRTREPADIGVRYADGSLRYLTNLENAA